MYDTHNSLSARLGNTAAVPKMNLSAAERALQEANGERGLAIKGAGASGRGNVVEVTGLADGTTAEDVEVRPEPRLLVVMALYGPNFRRFSSDVVPLQIAGFAAARIPLWCDLFSRTRGTRKRL